jgi:glycerophosphoryl diester phosphodiesterase
MKIIVKTSIYAVLFTLAGCSYILNIGGGFGTPLFQSSLIEKDSLVFAHGGISLYNAKNSSQSLRTAKALKFNCIEVEISSTKDNKLIVFHDNRRQTILQKHLTVSKIKFEDVSNFSINYNDAKNNESVLLLEQLFERFPDLILYLDIKEASKDVADELSRIVLNYGAENRVILASSNIAFISYTKRIYPQLVTCLDGFNNGPEWKYTLLPKLFMPDYYSGLISSANQGNTDFLNERDIASRKIFYGVNGSNLEQVKEF